MKNIKPLLFLFILFLFTLPLKAQNFYRPWKSYKPVKPQKPYERIDTYNTKLRQTKCYFGNYDYEPNEILTKLDIGKESTFIYFTKCCATHPSRCASDYIGTNDKTLLYTMVEKKAYRYMYWILNEGFVYDSYIDSWGIFREVDGLMVPIRNYTPMMLACKMGDLEAVKILRERGAYLSKPENAIGLTPYDFAKQNTKTATTNFIAYIDKEYQEETKNISAKKEYGTTFEANLLQDFIKELEDNLLKNEQRIIEKINQINKI
ncbi:MAG: ankyrin repeat domain-containing protein [Elusimicrobiaceae bacterium]|nr:ankyrin repeat domain-containing protein [Elusimicrobiaceae bacterium]